LNEYTLSLNWYLNPLTKLMANYTHAFLRDPDAGPSQRKVVGLRAQFQF
jgi:phosphate-selective porin